MSDEMDRWERELEAEHYRRSGNADAAVAAVAKGPVVGWRWADALRTLHRFGLTYEDQPEGIRAALAAAAALAEPEGADHD